MTFQAVSAQPGTGPLGRSALVRQATHDQVLTNHVIKNNTQRSWTRCLAACLNEDRCVSINYGDTGGICELNASHREAHPGDVVDKEGWRYGTQERSPVVELHKNKFQPIDCWDIQTNSPFSISGEHTVYPARRTGSLQVYCDMDSDEGGWTVFQRRVDNSQDFDLIWAEYKAGFGDLTRNFWLGNDALNELTSDRVYQLRIEMQSFSLVSMAVKYGHFRVATESNLYRLDIGTFYGSYDAGDSLGPTNSQPFSTKDRDNDDDFRHCAQNYLGPWWYKACIYACLNCPYINTDYVPNVGQGVVWGTWLNLYHSMKFAEMKIRPVEAMKGKDCYDLLMMGETISGVYNINVEGRDQPLSVYCEMVNAGGGWTVVTQVPVVYSSDRYWIMYRSRL
ncbi:techylectin-5A-like [Asterias rubens]|uniref:techylectin-5A-like n=1 Tax=Asterias rubens TaxID=7604 RepID=UPI0014559344|nr:techylectin-5A-like [Asterias rubens]